MKYQVIDWNSIFVRQEEDGNNLIFVKPYGHQVVLNKTGMRLLQHAKDERDTDIVLQKVIMYT